MLAKLIEKTLGRSCSNNDAKVTTTDRRTRQQHVCFPNGLRIHDDAALSQEHDVRNIRIGDGDLRDRTGKIDWQRAAETERDSLDVVGSLCHSDRRCNHEQTNDER